MAERKKILILDDEQPVAQTIALIAESAGFDARYEITASPFFAAIDTWAPDVLILDLVMPAEDGQQVLSRLADAKCVVPVILTSGVGRQMIDAAARSATERGLSVLGILAKPFSPATLRELLAEGGFRTR